MKSILVFCGSRLGGSPKFKKDAFLVGEGIGKKNYRLVYGGAQVGLMGAVADGCLSTDGKVLGILPSFFQDFKEVPHESLSELRLVDSMLIRKEIMFEESDLVVLLPGGVGSLDELFEAITADQLKLHQFPIHVLNTDGFYDPTISQMSLMIKNGFVDSETLENLVLHDTVESLLAAI
ncbi:MAG: TIGR00730 family Rossman fold protein [Bdellovibrionales bacterium]